MYSGRNFRLHLVTVVATLLFCFAVGELLVRIFLPFNNPDTIRQHSLQYVPTLFSRHRLKPVAQIVEEDSNKALGRRSANQESRQRFFINSFGYRGPEFVLRKPAGVIRVIIVGGSAVFDANAMDSGLNGAADWPHLVERLLKERGFSKVEVINAGIPGHASFDSLGRLYAQLWIYEPDYVLLYNAWNDVKYFTRLSPERPLIALYEPLVPGSNPFTEYQGLLDRFLAYSQLYVKFRNLYYSWRVPVGDEGAIPTSKLQNDYGPWGIKQYKLNMELFVAICRSIGANPILVTEATLVNVANSADEKRRIPYAYFGLTHSALVRAFEEVYGALRSIALKNNVPLVDLTKDVNGRTKFFSDAVHLTPEGGKIVASLLAEFLAIRLERDREKIVGP